MHRKAAAAALFLCAATLLANSVLGAGYRAGLITESDARRIGLERAWFTRVAIDSAMGEIVDLTHHVSSTDAYTVHEVTYDGGIRYFSEFDLDRNGEPVGTEQAKQLATRLVEDLERAELKPQRTERTIPAISMYITTDRGIVQALDAQTGRTRWISQAGLPSRAVEAASASDRYVAIANGSRLFLLNASDGKRVWEQRIIGTIGAGPILTNELLFIPLMNGTIESYQLADHKEAPWSFRSTGRTLVQPTFNGSVVAWPTDSGHLYVAQSTVQNVLYQVSTNNAILSRVAALHPGRLLVASVNGYVYCVEESNGNVQWRFSTGERVTSSPIVVGEAVFVVTDDGKLFRISGRTGDEEWPQSVGGIKQLLTASQERLYCLSDIGQLIVINAETGGRIGALNANLPDLPIANRQTDRLYLATRGGMIQCFHEVDRKWPMIHLDLAEAKQEAAPEENAPAMESPAPQGRQPAEADPFGTPAGADPFNTSGGVADPFGSGAAETDPFGTGSSAPAGTTDPFADPF